MEDIHITIQRIEDIHDKDGKIVGKQCFDADGNSVKVKGGKRGKKLWERWDELRVGLAYLFEMGKFTPPGKTEALPFVKDFKAVAGELSPPAEPAKVETPDNTKPQPAPQAVGMCTKELGDMIRAKYLKPIFGDEAYIELIKWYRSQILGITRINFDGSKLPQFKEE